MERPIIGLNLLDVRVGVWRWKTRVERHMRWVVFHIYLRYWVAGAGGDKRRRSSRNIDKSQYVPRRSDSRLGLKKAAGL